jgi:ABC-2 type transport system ATP-binding protein
MLSTHIMQEVEAVCSRVIIIDQGQIVADGSVEELSGAANGQLVVQVEFNQAINIKVLESLEGVSSVAPSGLNAYRVTAVAGMDVRPLIFDFAVKSGVSVISMQKEPQRLESVFRTLTKNIV